MGQKKNLHTRLLTLFALLTVLSALAGISGYLGLSRVIQHYSQITDNNLPHVKIAGEMFRRFRQVRISMMTLGLPGLNQAEGKKALDELKKYEALYDEAGDQYLSYQFKPGVVFAPSEKKAFEAAAEQWVRFRAVADQAAALYLSGEEANLRKIASLCLNEGEEASKAYNEAMNKLIDFNDRAAQASVAEAEMSSKFVNLLDLVLIVVGSIVTMAVGHFFAKGLTESVRGITQDLSQGAEIVDSAAQRITAASQDLSSSETEQAAALQQTVASLAEVSAMVDKNAENARRSQKGSKESQEAAQRGNQVVGEMIRSIQEISDSNDKIMQQVEASNHEFSQIVKVIAEISEKTKVINDIVFQTKLLSFNASVEAARAGEHGKGFAVVAEEVGNLAQMSGSAAKEISQLLESSIQKVESTVNQTKSKVEGLIRVGKEKVDSGSTTAKRCGTVLEEILQNVTSVGEMLAEITVACNEQATGVSEINKAMNQMDHVTQKNAAASQQATATVTSLSEEAKLLRGSVHKLFDLVEGDAIRAHSSLAANAHPQATVDARAARVIDFAAHRDAKSAHREPAPHEHLAAPLKQAVGGYRTPSGDDPRFEDI